MSNPKAFPELPAILPTNDLDCPEDPGGEVFAELNEFSIAPPEVLAERRRKAAAQREAEESAAAIARVARLDQGEHVKHSKPKPSNQPKTLTDAQKRTRKIRGWMLTQSSRPDLDTYCQAMDAARIAPPPDCRRAGKRTFEESSKVPKLRRSISAELSRLWKTRSPK